MTRAELADLMEQVFDEEIMFLREQGQKEYAHDTKNAFANFERIAEDLDLTKEEVLWVYAMKHRDGIASWIEGHKGQREDVTGRINDLIVYLFLLRGMIEEDRSSQDDEDKEYFEFLDLDDDESNTVSNESYDGAVGIDQMPRLSEQDSGVGVCPECGARYDLDRVTFYVDGGPACWDCFQRVPIERSKLVNLTKSPPQTSGTPSDGSEN